MKKILILASNPRKDLNLDTEIRDLKRVIESSRQREDFTVVDELAVRVGDLQELMLKHRPQIVHFCGHGGGEQGLVFESDVGREHLVRTEALANLFRFFSDDTECVLLNACYSEEQANAIVAHINYVIGMSQEIRDDAAIAFAKGFYRALGYACSIEEAYEFGSNAIQLEISGSSVVRSDVPNVQRKLEVIDVVTNTSIPEHLKPILKKKAALALDENSEIPSSNLNLSHEKKEEIQLNIDKLLREDAKIAELVINSENPAQGDAEAKKVFISYRSQEPDVSLAQEFHDRLQAAGHTAFMAAKSISWGENWIERIDQELKECYYFLLLLSEQSASSDMVAGEVRTARGLRDKVGKPIILPIRVNLPIDDPLNYELRSVLQTIQQKSWRSPDDTPILVKEILSLMAAGEAPEPVTVEIPVVATIEAKNSPPLPVADLELPGGTIPLESKFYVEREPWDERCCQEIERKAGLIRIKAPRQMGKTSLLTRIRNHATQQGYRAIALDFLETDEATFASSSIFLKRFCALVSRQLGISPRKVTEFWDEELFGPKENCSDYIEQYVLDDLTGPLFLGIDELDRLFPYDQVAKEFLMLLRAWNEKAKVNETWSKLRMVIAHSTESYVVMDTNSSPFNVGLAVELAEFTSSQMLDLAARHGLNWETGEVEQLMAMVGGHPYLVRLGSSVKRDRMGCILKTGRKAPVD